MDFTFSEEQELLRRSVREFAESRIASHTYCVSSASRNVGGHGLPLPIASKKSATWFTKLCSYPICRPGTHHRFM